MPRNNSKKGGMEPQQLTSPTRINTLQTMRRIVLSTSGLAHDLGYGDRLCLNQHCNVTPPSHNYSKYRYKPLRAGQTASKALAERDAFGVRSGWALGSLPLLGNVQQSHSLALSDQNELRFPKLPWSICTRKPLAILAVSLLYRRNCASAA